MPKTKRPEPDISPAILPNKQDFFVQGELKIVHCGAPMFVIDDVSLAELVRFHFKPRNCRDGFRLGRCQVVIVPVQE